MAFNFVSASDERSRFTAGIPVNGKKLAFSVPLTPFIPKAKFVEFHKWAQKNGDAKLVEQGKRPVEELFDFLMKLLDVDYADEFIEHLVYGEKEQLWREWERLSEMPLGESQDSANS